MTCGLPSERGVVPTLEALAPAPTVGLPLARSGGHTLAHAAAQALRVPESFANTYRVRPSVSSRIVPRLPLFATSTVAGRPLSVFGSAAESVTLLPPPQAASAKAVRETAVAAVRNVMRTMGAPLRVACRGSGSQRLGGVVDLPCRSQWA